MHLRINATSIKVNQQNWPYSIFPILKRKRGRKKKEKEKEKKMTKQFREYINKATGMLATWVIPTFLYFFMKQHYYIIILKSNSTINSCKKLISIYCIALVD